MNSNFRPPIQGEQIPMICSNCGYHGFGKLPRISIFNKNQKIKCPKCGKRAFSKDFRIRY